MSNEATINDDIFAAYAEQQEKEAKERNSRTTGGGERSYTEIAWSGLEKEKMKIIRAVGGPPDSGIDETTARTVRISWIVGDDGKKFRCILPERADQPDHIMWRIISRVKATEWVDKKKIYPVQVKHPRIFNIVEKNGFAEGDKQFMFDRGWEGRQVLIMNIIDREQMDWHRANKKTMLLSRQIGEGKDGSKFPEEGVPSYGFSSLLANLFKYYKSWEKYDIGITRLGLKETPYRVINAGKYLEEVPEHLQKYVVQGNLTDEEASWERYDLKKLFALTTYTKIYNRLKVTIAQIDAALGTHFGKEMEDLVAEEKVKFEEANKGATPSAVAAPPSKVVDSDDPFAETPKPAPARRVAPAAGSFDTSLLKGWGAMTSFEKDAIANVIVKDGKVTELKFKDPNAVLLACPQCGSVAPDSFTTCPVCALSFG